MHYHMKVTQGSDFEASFNTTDPETELPLNLTAGYTIHGRVAKTARNDEPTLYEWTVASGNLIPQDGSLVVKIPGSDSADWDFERVEYGIKIVNNITEGEVLGIHGPLTVKHTVE